MPSPLGDCFKTHGLRYRITNKIETTVQAGGIILERMRSTLSLFTSVPEFLTVLKFAACMYVSLY